MKTFSKLSADIQLAEAFLAQRVCENCGSTINELQCPDCSNVYTDQDLAMPEEEVVETESSDRHEVSWVHHPVHGVHMATGFHKHGKLRREKPEAYEHPHDSTETYHPPSGYAVVDHKKKTVEIGHYDKESWPPGQMHATKTDSSHAVRQHLDKHLKTGKYKEVDHSPETKSRRSASLMSSVFSEDAPTNSAGSGNIAGLGVGPAGEPGVSPNYQRKRNQLKLMNGPAVDPRMFSDKIFKRKPVTEGESLEGTTYHDNHEGSHSGQHNYTLWAQHHSREPDEASTNAGVPHAVGAASYSEHKGKAHINMIQTHPDHARKGVASGLIHHLHKKYGYKNIKWGMMTPEGSALKKKMDAKYKPKKAVSEAEGCKLCGRTGSDTRLGVCGKCAFNEGYRVDHHYHGQNLGNNLSLKKAKEIADGKHHITKESPVSTHEHPGWKHVPKSYENGTCEYYHAPHGHVERDTEYSEWEAFHKKKDGSKTFVGKFNGISSGAKKAIDAVERHHAQSKLKS